MIQRKIVKDAKYWDAFKVRKAKFDEENREFKEKRRREEEERTAQFRVWLTKNGLDKEAYDEATHGPVDHRCTNEVLRTLFDENYVRPDGWNSHERLFEIIFVRYDAIVTKKYIKCHKLCGAQFDHLCAIKLGTFDMDDAPNKRVELWFMNERDLNNEDESSEDFDEANPAVSHSFERGSLISKCKDIDSPLQPVFSVLIETDNSIF